MANPLNAPALEEYWERLSTQLRPFSPPQQRVAVALYRELAKGRAVDADQLGRTLGASAEEVRTLLEQDAIRALVHPDDDGRILGFGGLAVVPMHHRLEVRGRTLWTWCAWDSLFIPEILACPARVTSPDPETRESVRLVVTPDRVESVSPREAVVSFVQLEADVFRTSAANVMTKFCHFIFFFASRASGERWIARHPGTFLASLEDSFALAKRLNAHNFAAGLAKRAAV